ncbi:MAG TPA: hypothetical protein VHA14_01045, partial [Bryobacteraceae bacterium]|nr:hypothetical protein [Bryobacteraceae bacterium]
MDSRKHRLQIVPAALLAIALAGCSTAPKESAKPAAPTPEKIAWGTTPDGQTVDLYTLRNQKGAEARIMTYGGVLVSLKVPDSKGAMGDVVVGLDNFKDYLTPPPYFGALIGRYGNRIGHAQFKLDGVLYKLPKNDGDNTLHGGNRGFDKRLWTATPLSPQSLELKYRSVDGEEGFPGNLDATVTYTLTDANEL